MGGKGERRVFNLSKQDIPNWYIPQPFIAWYYIYVEKVFSKIPKIDRETPSCAPRGKLDAGRGRQEIEKTTGVSLKNRARRARRGRGRVGGVGESVSKADGLFYKMNMKTYKQAFAVLAVGIFIAPQIAFASWWNPLSWKLFSGVRQVPASVQVKTKATSTPEQSIKQNIETTQKNAKTEDIKPKKEVAKPPAISPTPTSKTTNKISATNFSNSQIIKKVKPSVVYIETDAGTGSGMIISSDGFVLTNAHVVQNFATARITLSSGSIYSALVVGRDENVDLAVLKIDAQNLAKVDFGDSNTAEQGDEVFTLGYPFGIKGDVSFKEGTISRTIVDGANTYLETSAEIHPGNSGGPLVNAEGNVIGVNSASFGQSIKGISVGETIKFAIPINVAKNLIPELKAGRQVIAPKTETPVAGDPFQTEDSNMKIAKCQATKQSSYDDAVLRINQATEKRLQEVYSSLQQQYKDAITKIYSGTNAQTLPIANIMAKSIYEEQQSFWQKQKTGIEKTKQTGMDQINAFLSTEYSKCISQ